MTDGDSLGPEILKAHLEGRTRLTESVVDVGKETFRITYPASADALFDEEEFERDESIPYWADLWPSAIALARYVSKPDLSGKRAIELGCGIGLPSVVALERGASVLATDHYTAALDFAAYNARTNVGCELRTFRLDWREPVPEGFGIFDLVLAADVLYERRNISLLADLVCRLLAPDGVMLLADPRRYGGELFIEEMRERGFETSREETAVEQEGREVGVSIHRIERGDDRRGR